MLFPLDIPPEVGLLNHMVVYLKFFEELWILFSIVAMSVYYPMNSTQYYLSSICYLFYF